MRLRMSAQESRIFQELLRNALVYVEFGVGGSTELACAYPIKKYYCVESDRAWINKCSEVAAIKEKLNSQLTFFAADIGPTGKWGHPIQPITRAVAERYHGYVWSQLSREDRDQMLVLVDGRFRVACACQALMHARPGDTLCIHDYSGRPHLGALDNVLSFQVFDTLAVAVVPSNVDLVQAEVLLDKFSCDSR